MTLAGSGSRRIRVLCLSGLLAALLATYATFFTGDVVSGDNLVQFYQTTQLVDQRRAAFTLDEVAAILRAHDLGLNTRFAPNRDGLTYSTLYGVGQSLLAAPLFVALRLLRWGGGGPVPADLTLWCACWVAFGAVLVLLTIAAIDLARVGGVWWPVLLTLAAAFGSPYWMFTGMPFNVVGETVLVAAAIVLCLWMDQQVGDTRAGHAAAFMLALVLTWSVLTRPFAATAVPAFVVWAVRGNPHAARVKTFLATLAAGGVLVLSWNTWYFGSPFATGYDALGRAINFESPWAAGFAGTLFNPTLSLFYFFPLLALALAALAYLALRRDVLAGFALLFLAPQLYLIPRYSFWFGGPDLFARLWLRVVPVAFLLIIVAAARVQRRAAISALAFGAVSLLVLVGAKAQALAAMTDERAVYAESVARLEREDPGVGEQQHRASLAALITGRTVVARVQVDRLRTPRRFVVARRAATPVDRLPAALLGILASVVLAVQYWRLRK